MLVALPLKIKVIMTEFMADDFSKGFKTMFLIEFWVKNLNDHPWERTDLQWFGDACSTRLGA